MSARFWRWWWRDGRERARLAWHVVQVGLVVAFAARVAFVWMSGGR